MSPCIGAKGGVGGRGKGRGWWEEEAAGEKSRDRSGVGRMEAVWTSSLLDSLPSAKLAPQRCLLVVMTENSLVVGTGPGCNQYRVLLLGGQPLHFL